MMQREWRALGHAMPVHMNGRARKSFTTFLPEPRDLGESTAQVAPEVAPQVAPQVGGLVDALNGEMNRTELMAAMGLRDRMHFSNAYLNPAIETGLLKMTIPDKPNSRLQRYRLTDAGKALRARRDAARRSG
jgi:ATP-dependent DNA helicase RecG